MDQVFLQDSILLRRHQTSSDGDAFLATSGSPVVPEDNQLLLTFTTMTNSGDDCFFYYYSTCTKGDSCPFRHCEAAMGNEIVCNLWQEGCCFRPVCKFRHMKITKNRKVIPCYWENQPAGCQKPHCAFLHEKPRYIEGVFVPADKSQIKTEELQHEEQTLPPAPLLPNTANPQLRGVIKTETQEPVPSPTHPPVVINPADDDEDEDDQFSEEGEDGKIGPSPKKMPKSGDSLNFGVSTLEEIRLRKALKASMKKSGYPIQSAESSANREKENIHSLHRPTLSDSRGSVVFEEAGRPRGSVAERLGRKVPSADFNSREGVPLKRSLAERLGGVVDEEQPSVPHKALKPIKERLGLHTGPGVAAYSAETCGVSTRASEPVRIKTLEEIQQEKAAKSVGQNPAPLVITTTSQTKATRVMKRVRTVKVEKTFSEVFQAKKQKQNKEEEQNPSQKKPEQLENALGKNQVEPDHAQSPPEPTTMEKFRVKTLEEIRREKAAKIQVKQAETKKDSDTEGSCSKKRQLLHVKKLPNQSDVTAEQSVERTEKPLKTPAAAPETSNTIKVKTFEEIMREKRLRKQEMEEQVKSSAEADSSQNQTAMDAPSRKVPIKSSLESSASSSTPLPSVPVRKLISLRPEASSALKRTASAASDPVRPSSPLKLELQLTSREVTDKDTTSSTLQPSAKRIKEPHQVPATEKPLDRNPSPTERPVDSKVRPKLNVKPSVMKPAVQVKPGQKKRGASRSAVAAVKPLSSATTVQEESLQKPACNNTQGFPTSNGEAQLVSAVPRSPTMLPDSGFSSSPLREELQTVPVFTRQEPKPAGPAAAREFCSVPQSPVLKTSPQVKSRRSSAAASRSASISSASISTSAVDDFEELINQFTDDHIEEDVDPALGEDDLLQELSEMIDS